MFFAAQEKGSSTASSSQGFGRSERQDAEIDAPAKEESVAVEPAQINHSVSLPVLNAEEHPPLLSPSLAPNQPTLAAYSPSSASAKGGVASASDAEKTKASTSTEKSAAGASAAPAPTTLQSLPEKNVTDAMLVPLSLPNMFAALPKFESTTLTGDNVSADKSDSIGSTKSVLGDTASDKPGAAVSPSLTAGQQEGLAASRAAGNVQATAAENSAGDGKQAGSAKTSDTTDLAGSKSSVDGASGAASSSAASSSASTTANAGTNAGASTSTTPSAASGNSTATADAARDPAAGSSSAANADTPAAPSTGVPGATTASATDGSAVAPTHDAGGSSTVPTAAHEMAAAPTAQGAQSAPTAVPDAGATSTRGDGLERSATANPGLGNANAHALLDGAGATSTGREGTWQITPNRVEAGFANGQDSWTSVVAQRQQGHVTAMLELGSAAEHSSTSALLPQLNTHLAERQMPVEQLGVSVRQQFTSNGGAGNGNQGQPSNPSNSSAQPQRAAQALPVAAAPTASDGSRISIRA